MSNSITVVTNGNDGQVQMIEAMFASFRTFWDLETELETVVVSDDLSVESIDRLIEADIQVEMLPVGKIDDLNAVLASNVHPLGKIAKPFFLRWFLESHRHSRLYIYTDPDTLMVAPVSKLCGLHKLDRVTVSQSLLPTMAHTCVSRLQKAVDAGQMENIGIARTKPEVCTGFFMANREQFLELLESWTAFMLSEPFNANKNSNEFGFGWHDQDFFRCLSALNAEFESTLNILSPIDIAITNPPADRLYDVSIKGDDISTIQVKWPSSVRPGVMMHFAGGTHTAFPDIEALYSSR